MRQTALAGLLLLAACNRDQAALTPDADAEARNATAAKTLADIQAAEEASRKPLPAAPRPRVIRDETPAAPVERPVADDEQAPGPPPPPQ